MISTAPRECRKAQLSCPICGHNDWCFVMEPKNYPGGVLFGCRRGANFTYKKGDVFNGTDGNNYVVTSVASDESIWYAEPVSQYKARHASVALDKPVYQKKSWVYEDQVLPLPAENLDLIYRAFLKGLFLEDRHREYLHSEGFSDEMISHYMIVSFPEPDYYRFQNDSRSKLPLRCQLAEKLVSQFGGSLEGVPGAFINKRGKWTFAQNGGILFPVFNYRGQIIRLRIRLDRRFFDSAGKDINKEHYDVMMSLAKSLGSKPLVYSAGKYINLSSYSEDKSKLSNGIIGNYYDHGCQAGNALGFYYPKNGLASHSKLVYVTEGEKKSMQVATKLGSVCISVPGVNSWSLLFKNEGKEQSPAEFLLSNGISIIVVAYDSDKETNLYVLNSEKALVARLKEFGFLVAVASWDPEHGKGIDDLINNGYKPSYEIV